MDHAIVPRHIVLWCNAQLTLADALMRIGPADPVGGCDVDVRQAGSSWVCPY
jgi:hypothetical protein